MKYESKYQIQQILWWMSKEVLCSGLVNGVSFRLTQGESCIEVGVSYSMEGIKEELPEWKVFSHEQAAVLHGAKLSQPTDIYSVGEVEFGEGCECRFRSNRQCMRATSPSVVDGEVKLAECSLSTCRMLRDERGRRRGPNVPVLKARWLNVWVLDAYGGVVATTPCLNKGRPNG